MKNPLNRRIWRELKQEFGKYLVIFLLLAGSIGFVSGFLVADGSMIIAYQNSFEDYTVEDGNFLAGSRLGQKEAEKIEACGVSLYENFYVEEEASNGSTLRIFRNRREVNRVCLMEGGLPRSEDEIAIDRMYADNNHISTGDVLEAGGRKLTVSGLVALPDYSTMFQNNNDSMFDAVKFGVAVMTEEGLGKFEKSDLCYNYSWIYVNQDSMKDEASEMKASEELLKGICSVIIPEDFIPRYLNQAIQFTGEDMGSDKVMMTALLYIIIAIMAFVFGVTISNTIAGEASVIGTLRASGYTKAELIRHYMAAPMLVTLIAAFFGNALGYTVFKTVCVNMYYKSYSLPTYHTVWSAEAFLMTTVVPFLLMLVINFGILANKLSLTPLQFLRRDLGKSRKKRTLCLNQKLAFFSRFRIRIMLQNTGSYATLFVGILFANLLLMYGLLFPSVLDHFQGEIVDKKLCGYQYVLKNAVQPEEDADPFQNLYAKLQVMLQGETENQNAEKFAVTALEAENGAGGSEEVMVYGVQKDSRYVKADFEAAGVYLSEGYASKFGLSEGEQAVLKEKYGSRQYEFEIAGIYDYPGALAVFMPVTEYRRIFGYDDTYFNGYFSDSEITDLEDSFVAAVIDEEDLTKLSRQLDLSMGSMMLMVDGFAVIMFMVLIYLLSKIIIEKNAQSISMVKILGYTNGEISRLYIVSTAVIVTVFLLVSLPVEYAVVKQIFLWLMQNMKGWITFYVDPVIYVKMFLLGIGTYAVVAALEYRKIRQVPLGEALKNVE